jgi:putative glutamine transport system permease protein
MNLTFSLAKGGLPELILDPYNYLALLRGLSVTLQISSITILLSFALGTLVGVARGSGHPIIGRLAGIYVEAMRNSPVILLILFAKFVLRLDPFTAGVVGLTAFTTAILAEVIRAGLASIDRGQWEAARSQGFTWAQCLRYVVLPQAIRKVVPPVFSQFTTVVKDSAYVWVLNLEDLTGRGMILAGKFSSPAQFLTIMAFIGAIYFSLCWLLGQAARWVERRGSWLTN